MRHMQKSLQNTKFNCYAVKGFYIRVVTTIRQPTDRYLIVKWINFNFTNNFNKIQNIEKQLFAWWLCKLLDYKHVWSGLRTSERVKGRISMRPRPDRFSKPFRSRGLSGVLFHGFEQWFQYHVCGYSIVEKISQKSLAHLRFTIEMVKMNAPHAEASTKH